MSYKECGILKYVKVTHLQMNYDIPCKKFITVTNKTHHQPHCLLLKSLTVTLPYLDFFFQFGLVVMRIV